jgi:hypothetical protein
MSMPIQGPKRPRNDINLYLKLLKHELDTLWVDSGVNTWDDATEDYFIMRVVLITMVQDYLVYRDISQARWSAHFLHVVGTWMIQHTSNQREISGL